MIEKSQLLDSKELVKEWGTSFSILNALSFILVMLSNFIHSKAVLIAATCIILLTTTYGLIRFKQAKKYSEVSNKISLKAFYYNGLLLFIYTIMIAIMYFE